MFFKLFIELEVWDFDLCCTCVCMWRLSLDANRKWSRARESLQNSETSQRVKISLHPSHSRSAHWRYEFEFQFRT